MFGTSVIQHLWSCRLVLLALFETLGYAALEDQKFFLCQLTFKEKGLHIRSKGAASCHAVQAWGLRVRHMVELVQSSLRRLLWR